MGQDSEGFVVSSIVNVADVFELFPQVSVAVKVPLAAPVAPHPFDRDETLLFHVTPLQASVALAPPCELVQLLKSVVFPIPLHSTVKFDAAVVIVGEIVSTIVMI